MGRYPALVPTIGERYGKLTITEVLEQNAIRRWLVNCTCACGNKTVNMLYANLRSGNTTSCGCVQRARTSAASKKHGETGTPLWKTWTSMRQRCADRRTNEWNRYGGRGIQVCEEWWNSFIPFRDWALASGYEPGLTIDRIDNDGDYTPNNCRWATQTQQARNRSSNVFVEFAGERKTIADWAEDPRSKVSSSVLGARLRRGWDFEVALTAPPQRRTQPS